MYSTIQTTGLHGLESYPARVEVDCSRGLPSFEMVGLLGSEVKEARERIRVALKNAQIDLPVMRITVNISPASLHKEGTAYDLPVAAGILVAQGMIPQEYVKNTMIAGELGLGGEIRPVRGILPMVLEARKQGMECCIIPEENLEEAELVGGIRLIGLRHLAQLPEVLGDWRKWKQGDSERRRERERGRTRGEMPDFGEVKGQAGARRAAVVAAAGFHHLLMVGPPGGGKTMIARCIPSILPPLSLEEELEVASVYSVAGRLSGESMLARPFVAPHHTVSASALTGGGQLPVPGAVSLAHRGVLFLDELTEFKRSTLDLLRQPLEEHQVRIARSNGTYSYPADFMLVAAMNPCPCGFYPDRNKCRCSPTEVQRYLGRISGPILDRMDLCVEVERVDFAGLMGERGGTGENSGQLRARVMEARERQEKRYREEGILYNAQLSPGQLRRFCRLGLAQQQHLERMFDTLSLSARGCHRLLRVARTLADLDGAENVEKVHLSEAACYRMAGGKYWKA